ncbi:MAG TPA: iron-containing alcohol dehydrogenase [Dehalococcoidales bacterium]|nr:iron-containing alcohol dehydrogenase [Dehalococcoidales bacterium]
MNELSSLIPMRIPRALVGMNASEQIGGIGKELGARKALIVTDQGVNGAGLIKGAAESLQKAGIPFEIFDKCAESAPISLIKECASLIRNHGINMVVGIGGGSVLDLTKITTAVADHGGSSDLIFNSALIVKKDIITVLVPTTAGTGSEINSGALCTDDETHRKVVVRSTFLAADAAILDPALTLRLPPAITAETGMDALCHAIEAYTSAKANTVADMFAEKAIQLISRSIKAAYTDGPRNPEARYNMLLAASFGILGANSSSTYIVHTLSYPLGMMTHTSHGKACVLMLPYAMEFHLTSRLERFARIAELMGEPVQGLTTEEKAHKSVQIVKKLAADFGLPLKLSEIGLKQKDIPAVVDYVFQYYEVQLANNPRPINREDLKHILESAL